MRSRAALAAALVVSAILSVVLAETCAARRRGGFVARAEREISRQISAARLEEETAALSVRPHRAGTAENVLVARRIARRLESAGLKVWSTPLEVGLWEPAEVRLSLAGRGEGKGWDLSEGDPAGGPAFLAWSPDADLSVPVVYAGAGTAADYETLAKAGVPLKGRLALVRAQGLCRGMKARIAAARGLAGLLLYPEPRDQGFAKPAYPEGPNTPPNAVERGSLLAYFLYPGDPAGARRAGVETLPPIPAIGVSQDVARDLLSAMTGDAAPEEWQGWLKAPYVLAKNGPVVHLVVRGRVETKTLQNVFAVVPGENDRALPVLVGSHFDAWVNGAVDPSSGTAAVLETAEALAQLRASWWRPERSVLFAFWDGEEPGMFGSTRWVEQTIRESFGGLAAYVNVDSAVRAGDFVGNVTPGLRGPLDEVLARVVDPATGRSVAETKGTYRLPGFSSDAAPFLGLTGTPVAEIGFGHAYPVYHTRFDSIDWIRRFGDPGFAKAALFARILTLYVGRLANDAVMPYRFAEVAAHTREALRAMESEKPSTAAWLPAPIRGLRSEIDLFEAATRRWEETRGRQRSASGPRARKANALVEKAMASFGLPATTGRPTPFGHSNLLVAPSIAEGCPGEAHGVLAEAFRVRDVASIERESAQLAQAYAQAREYLTAAEWILQGKGEAAPRGR
jgi:N-acetylated-alpha-linked acidic dipeptidase